MAFSQQSHDSNIGRASMMGCQTCMSRPIHLFGPAYAAPQSAPSTVRFLVPSCSDHLLTSPIPPDSAARRSFFRYFCERILRLLPYAPHTRCDVSPPHSEGQGRLADRVAHVSKLPVQTRTPSDPRPARIRLAFSEMPHQGGFRRGGRLPLTVHVRC